MAKRRKNKKKLIIRIIILVAILGFVAYIFLPKSQEVETAGPTAYEVTAELVEISMGVEVSGIITPIEVDEHFFVEGSKVSKIYVEEGDYVTKGTLLAELDTSRLELQQLQAEENLAALRLNGSPSAIRQAELMLDSAQTALEDARLYSNIDGYVSSIGFEEGKFVAGIEMLRVIDTTGYTATASVDEAKVHRVSLGQEVTMDFDVIPNKTFIGTITKIPLEGRVNQQGFSVLDIEITLDDPEGELTSPFSFTGEIIADTSEKFIIIPSNAVYTDENGGRYVRLVVEEGKTEPVYVKTEFYSGNLLRVFSGVSEGDRLLVDPEPIVIDPFGMMG